MSLYNAKTSNGCYRITKFTEDLDVESSYETSGDGCTCPAGHRDTCRHRQMLLEFVRERRADSPWFYEFDNGKWFYFNAEVGRFMTHEPWPKWRRV